MFSYNLHISQEQPSDLEFLNRGFLYGDGFFETMYLFNSNIPLLHYHFKRLKDAHEAFGLTINFSFDSLKTHLKELSQRSMIPDGRVKIICWRKTGGLYTPSSTATEVLIQIGKMNALPDYKSSSILFDEVPNIYTKISRFKTLSAAKYVQAGIYMKKHGAEEVILVDQSLHISEALYSNIFWIKDDQLFTPALETGCIEGTMRSFILEKNDCQQGLFTIEDLKKADFCFTTNAVGLTPVLSFEGTRFKDQHSFFEDIKQTVPF